MGAGPSAACTGLGLLGMQLIATAAALLCADLQKGLKGPWALLLARWIAVGPWPLSWATADWQWSYTPRLTPAAPKGIIETAPRLLLLLICMASVEVALMISVVANFDAHIGHSNRDRTTRKIPIKRDGPPFSMPVASAQAHGHHAPYRQPHVVEVARPRPFTQIVSLCHSRQRAGQVSNSSVYDWD